MPRKCARGSFHPVGYPLATSAVATGSGLGRRICLVHAVSETGLASKPADLPGVVGDIDTPLPHCEMMFAAKDRVGDYHGNFNHSTFMKWVRNQFVPWVKANYPHLLQGAPGATAPARLALQMDNVPYHSGSVENLVAGADLRFTGNPLSSTKKALLQGMELAGCASLTAPHSHQARQAQRWRSSRTLSCP